MESPRWVQADKNSIRATSWTGLDIGPNERTVLRAGYGDLLRSVAAGPGEALYFQFTVFQINKYSSSRLPGLPLALDNRFPAGSSRFLCPDSSACD